MIKAENSSKFTPKSIKIKLILFACLVLAFSISVASYLNLSKSQTTVGEKIEENMLANAETAAEGIGKEVAAMKAIVEIISADDRLRGTEPAIIAARLS